MADGIKVKPSDTRRIDPEDFGRAMGASTMINDETGKVTALLHPTTVMGLTPSKELGKEIMKLRYDLIKPIIAGMIAECQNQIEGDTKRGREKLVTALAAMWGSLRSLEISLEDVIEICQPHIDKEKEGFEAIRDRIREGLSSYKYQGHPEDGLK